jgi:hypothetical protein
MSRVGQLTQQALHPLHRADHGAKSVAHREHVGGAVPDELQVLLDRDRLGTDLKGYRRVLDRAAQRPGDALHHRDSRRAKDIVAKPVQNDHVAAISQVVITVDHQDVGIHGGGAEMALRGRISDIGGQVVGYVEAVVVADLHAGHDQDADDCDDQRGREHRTGPAHRRGAHAPPAPRLEHSSGVEQTKPTGHRDNGRGRGQRSGDHDEQPQSRRDAQRLEIRQSRQVQAESGSSDGQPRAHDDVRGPAEHRVIGGFSILTGLARLLVATDEKDRVIGSRRDRQRGQHGHDECRESQQTVVTEERDEPSGRAHLETHHDQNQQHRADGAVGDKEHGHDDHTRDAHHFEHAFIGGFVHVGGQRCRTGDVDLEPVGRRRIVDDLPDRFDGLVSLGAALVAGQVELDVSGFAVPALDAGGRKWISPHVVDMLQVLGVGLQLCHHAVVVAVCLLAELLIAFQNDHRDAVRV